MGAGTFFILINSASVSKVISAIAELYVYTSINSQQWIVMTCTWKMVVSEGGGYRDKLILRNLIGHLDFIARVIESWRG